MLLNHEALSVILFDHEAVKVIPGKATVAVQENGLAPLSSFTSSSQLTHRRIKLISVKNSGTRCQILMRYEHHFCFKTSDSWLFQVKYHQFRLWNNSSDDFNQPIEIILASLCSIHLKHTCSYWLRPALLARVAISLICLHPLFS